MKWGKIVAWLVLAAVLVWLCVSPTRHLAGRPCGRSGGVTDDVRNVTCPGCRSHINRALLRYP